MNRKKNEHPALKVFGTQYPRAQKPSIDGENLFLGGRVYEVLYTENDSQNENKVYVILVDGCEESVAPDTRAVIKQLNDVAEKKLIQQKPSVWINFLSLSGLIALILVMAILYMVIFAKQEVPEFLTATFLAVIGFYFGGIKNKVSQKTLLDCDIDN